MRTLTESFSITSLCHPSEANEPEMAQETDYGQELPLEVETRYSSDPDGPSTYQAIRFQGNNGWYSIAELKEVIRQAEQVKELDLKGK